MKTIKIIVTFVIAISVFTACKNETNAIKKIKKINLQNAENRDKEIKKGNASISFDKTVFDFGTVNEGDIVETIFEVTNSGKTDLVIMNAQPSCGCTVPVWPKTPIKPGETGEVKVKFNTNGKPNRQHKTITLSTNTVSGREVLSLKGSVIPKQK